MNPGYMKWDRGDRRKVGRLALYHRKARRGDDEDGFSLMELSIVVLLISILLVIATLSYANASSNTRMSGAKKQIESAISRAKTAARQQNATYQLIFYTNENVANANSFEFRRNVKGPDGSWTMTPVDESVSGEKVSKSGDNTYIRVMEGVKITGCNEIPGDVIIVNFRPSGTTMSVYGTGGSGGPASQPVTINIATGGLTGSVVINSLGGTRIN